jgi:hypothetical protein
MSRHKELDRGFSPGAILFDDDLLTTPPTFEELLSQSMLSILRSVFEYSGDTADAVCLFIEFNRFSDDVSYMPMFRYGKDFYNADEISVMSESGKSTDVDKSKSESWLDDLLRDYITKSLVPLYGRHHKMIPTQIWVFYDLVEEKHTDEMAIHLHVMYDLSTNSRTKTSDIDESVRSWVSRTMSIHSVSVQPNRGNIN